MTSSVFTNPSPQYFTTTGEVCAGGTLKFFATGTTNAQDVYSDSSLSTNIGSEVTLGSDGRAAGDSGAITIYLDDSLTYRAQLFDANGAKQFDVDPVNPAASDATTIPALVDGEFLTNDGSQLLWSIIRQLPDPSGNANKILTTDGTDFSWIAKPGSASITVGTKSVKLTPSSGSPVLIQAGSDTMTASSTHTASKAITFPTEFDTVWAAWPILRSQSVADHSWFPILGSIFQSTTGFTAVANTNSDDDTIGNIIDDVPFDWVAIGTVSS